MAQRIDEEIKTTYVTFFLLLQKRTSNRNKEVVKFKKMEQNKDFVDTQPSSTNKAKLA